MGARDRLRFVVGLVAAWLFFLYLAHLTPIQLDDWYEVAWHHHHSFTLGHVLGFARYNYFNYNPRPGETLLLLVNGPPIIHLLITPIMQVLLLLVVYTLAHGRLPRPGRGVLAELLVMQALIWLAIPRPGTLYFYRPFATNYLFASAIQLSLFVPFRLELGRPEPGPARRWLVPIVLTWGVVAGMTNEHTGPAAIVLAIALVIGAARARRLRAWMVAAAVGLAVGYGLLFFAPGQTVRYAGLGVDLSPLATIRSHGVYGCVRILAQVVSQAQAGALLVVGLALWARRRRPDAIDALDLRALVVIALSVVTAGMITVTLFASPIVEDRVMLAPTLLLAIALGAATAVPWREPRARAALIVAAGAIVAYNAIGFVATYRGLAAESAARVAALEHAGPGDVVKVPPSAWPAHDAWSYGEDLQWAYMREFVAHRVFDVGGLELAPLPPGAQPTPPEHMQVAVTYDPPLDARAARPDWPLWRFVPTQWAWIVREIRESLAYLDAVPGHRLRAIDVTVVPATPGLPPGKPIYIVRWRDGRYQHADLHFVQDRLGWPFESVRDPALPIEPTEAWLSACGRTRAIALRRVGDDLRVPVEYDCSGNHTIYVCDARACWLAGRYW